MKRFILLTFGFLGWAFYEMSGGADFKAPSAPVAEIEPATVTVAANITPLVQDKPAPKVAKVVPVDTTPPGFDDTPTAEEVSRVSVSLTTVDAAVEAALQPLENAVTLVPVNAGSTISSESTPAIIPSLITPNDTGSVAVNVSTSGDIRSVSGNRVNVRGGPGTDYGIVSRLVRGDAVEVISDNGDGWVQMRPVDGGPVGWMADFLLTNG